METGRPGRRGEFELVSVTKLIKRDTMLAVCPHQVNCTCPREMNVSNWGTPEEAHRGVTSRIDKWTVPFAKAAFTHRCAVRFVKATES